MSPNPALCLPPAICRSSPQLAQRDLPYLSGVSRQRLPAQGHQEGPAAEDVPPGRRVGSRRVGAPGRITQRGLHKILPGQRLPVLSGPEAERELPMPVAGAWGLTTGPMCWLGLWEPRPSQGVPVATRLPTVSKFPHAQ